jgi:thymidylate synthase
MARRIRRKNPMINEDMVPVAGLNIFANYNGKLYKAVYYRSGDIIYNGVKYMYPSQAAIKVTKIIGTNGWLFWEFEDENGDAHPLNYLR